MEVHKMIEENIDIPTHNGSMNTFVVFPEEDGPHPVVFFYMDAPGKREELHDMARRLASVGYFVVLPNLYYRRSRDFYLKERTPEAMTVMFSHMDSLNAQTSQTDTQAMLTFVDNHPMADQKHIGAVGYCMSGPIVMWVAAQFPDRFLSIASIHGANMATDAPDSPHLMAPQIKCESYFACAEIDKWATPEAIQKLESSLMNAKSKFRIEWYPKAEHGFVFPQRAGIYNAQAAERHWERLFELFGRTLSSLSTVN
jgi:carboxymethylenebutenolidase